MTETFCTHCGGLHDPGAETCRLPPLAGLTLPDGIRVLSAQRPFELGVLYHAEYPGSDVEVEVAFLHPKAAARLRDQFARASGIAHPNVATIAAVGETPEGVCYVALEEFRGELLSEILTARHVLPLPEAADLILQAAAGLQAAHEAGLRHGNLSPDAILVTRTVDNRPLVKLVGFSVLQLSAKPAEKTGVCGAYAAPERLAGQPPDERSDVYSLGAVLHHLVTGVPPSVAPESSHIVPIGVWAVIKIALEPAPEHRFGSAAAFAGALARAATASGAAASSRGMARGARIAAAVGALLIVVVAGIWLRRTTERSGSSAEPVEAATRIDTSTAAEPQEGVASPSEPADTTSSVAPPHSRRRAVSGPHPAASPHHPDGSSASASLLVDVRSVDSTIQVDLRYATANNFTGAPLPGYEARRALLRREVAAALGRVQTRLRSEGLGLRVFDAYRPVRATLAMVDWARRTGQRGLLESGYIAERSRHNLGVAVDLAMVDLVTGTEVPMSTTLDNLTDTAPVTNAIDEALRYRKILVHTMESEGFSPHARAWWHFNYPLEGAVPLDQVIR